MLEELRKLQKELLLQERLTEDLQSVRATLHCEATHDEVDRSKAHCALRRPPERKPP